MCILLLTTQNNKYDVFHMAKTKLMQNFILLQHSACICTCIPVIIIELDRCTGCKADSYQDNKDSIYKLENTMPNLKFFLINVIIWVTFVPLAYDAKSL